MKRIGRIQLATLAVVIAGIVARTFWRGNSPSGSMTTWETLYFGLLFAQLMLLGIWGAVGTGVGEWRVVGVIIGLFGLAGLNVAELWRESFGFLIMVVIASVLVMALPTFITVTVIGLYRIGRTRLHRFTDGAIPEVVDRWQFSIRRIMAVTAGVAAICGLSRALLAAARDPHALLFFLAPLGMACVGYPAISLAIVWACLSLGRPGPRLAVVAVAAAMIGLAPLLLVDREQVWAIHLIVLAIAVSVTAGHLLIVRSAGFRLVPLAELYFGRIRVLPHPDLLPVGEGNERAAPLTSSESSPPADRRT